MIIAVEGHSSSEIAAELSSYLKYSLINPEDVAPALRNFLPSSSNNALSATSSKDLDNLSFKIMYQIASVQLRLKLGVVINLTLSNLSQFEFDQLKQLANSQGVELILIRCRSGDEIVEGGITLTDEIVGVHKLPVDAYKPFDVENFVSENLPQVFPKVPDSQIPKGNLEKTSSMRPSRQKLIEKTSRHLHRLILHSKPSNEASTLRCKRCQNHVSGPNYQCIVCDQYIFDKACAELPGDLDKIRETCPDQLKARKPEYRFPENQRCKMCERDDKYFSYDCHDCLFETNMKGEFLPIVVNHETHSHPLNLIIMPLSYNYEFLCCGCGEFGKSISYRCYDCNFNLHVSCLLLPQVIHSNHHEHPLVRRGHDPLETKYWDKKHRCDRCRQEIEPGQWFCDCAKCDFVIHVRCAF